MWVSSGHGQWDVLRTVALLGLVGLASAAKENAPGTTGLLEAAVGGKRTLVLADGPRIQDSHSMFFSALQVGALERYMHCAVVGTSIGTRLCTCRLFCLYL